MAKIDPASMECFWTPGERTVHDIVKPGEELGVYGKKPLSAYPGAQRVLMDTASAAITELAKSKPQRITEDQYNEALEVLPPEGWVEMGRSASFKSPERLSGPVTAIYARVPGPAPDYEPTFWMFHDVFTLKHEVIVDRIWHTTMTTPASGS